MDAKESERKRVQFDMDDFNIDSPTESRPRRHDPIRGQLLKEELYNLVNREKESIEYECQAKITKLLQGFKQKKLEWEQMVKMERDDLESEFERERQELNASFSKEIAQLTRQFEDEKCQVIREYEEKIVGRERTLQQYKNDYERNFREDTESLKGRMRSEFEQKLTEEKELDAKRHQVEMDNMEKKFESTRQGMEATFKRQAESAEAKLEKALFEVERRHAEEKANVERESQRRVEQLETSLRKEAYAREEVERSASAEKGNLQAVNVMLKEEINKLKEEVDRIKKKEPSEEVTLMAPPQDGYACRIDLPPRLRDDFDRLIEQYKQNLKEKFQKDSSELEQRLEQEKEKLRSKIQHQRNELDKRLTEGKQRLERDFDRSRDDIEKEIERRMRTKQLQESLAEQQKRFDDVTRRLSEEEKSRNDEKEAKEYANKVHELTLENEGLKLKVKALEDNNHVLKNLKEEGQQEVDRLRVAVEELKSVVESRKDQGCSHLILDLMKQNKSGGNSEEDSSVRSERRKLEQLRLELQQQQRDIRDKKNVEEAAKLAMDMSTDRFDSLLHEKNRLETSLKSLEGRVINMQDEFTKMKAQTPTSQPVYHAQLDSTDAPFSFIPIHSPVSTPHHMTPHHMTPQHMTSFHHQQQEDYVKTKLNNERLTTELEEAGSHAKNLLHENNMLERQLRDMERQIERCEDDLEKEKETSSNLRELVQEHKNKFNEQKEEAEKHVNNIVKLKREFEERRLQLELEVEELKSKLQHAHVSLNALRKQAQDDVFAPDHDGVVGVTKTLGLTDAMAVILAKERHKEKFETVKSLKTEPDRVRKLEEDKKRLEKELTLVKESLQNYTDNLESQFSELERRFDKHSSRQHYRRGSVYSRDSRDSPDNDRGVSPTSSYREDEEQTSLRIQKTQLKRLIERLTAMKP